MNVKETLLRQYERCYNENGWFVAVRNAIDGITAEQAAWKPAGSDNSIWKTLAHLSYYNNAYLQRFKGIDYEYDKPDNDATFEAGASEAEWNAAVEKFDAVMNEFRELLKGGDEKKFGEPVSGKNNASWADLINDINAHNAYHGGQILLLRKLQGAWNPDKGVS